MEIAQSTWLPALLLALSSNLDNVGVGVAYGIRKVGVPLVSNLVIALITSTGTVAAMLAGRAIGRLLQPGLANLVGGSLLIGLGGWVAFQETRSSAPLFNGNGATDTSKAQTTNLVGRVSMILDNPFSADQDFSRHIDRREALVLGFALSLNNLVNGVAAGIAGLQTALVTALVFMFSVITLWLGISAGYRFGAQVPSRYTGVVSAVLLVSIGLYEIFL